MKSAALIGAFALTAIVSACGASEPYDPDNPVEAEAQCESFAEDRLRSPATAEFDLNALDDTGGTWTVTGTVDSENGFGALIRSQVSCVIRFTGDTANLVDITITE